MLVENGRLKFATAEEAEAHLHKLYRDVDDYDVEIVRHFQDKPRKKRGAWSVFVWVKGHKHDDPTQYLRAAFKADAA